MRRSYVALALVILASAVALYFHLQTPSATEPPSSEPKDQAKAPTPIEHVTPPPKEAEPKKEPEAKQEPPKKEEPAPPKEKAPEPAPTPVDADAALKAAEAQLTAGKVADALKTLSDAIAKTPDAKAAPLKDRLTKLATEHFFSSKPSPLATTYVVAAGDKLKLIAANHNTTDDFIARLNGIKDKDIIRVGQKLKIVQGAFDIEVAKTQYKLTVYKDGLWVREIKVGLGKDGVTPIGEYKAGTRIKEPPYTAVVPHVPYGDKQNNPLGTRWITITGAGGNEYGIHGTWEPESIGKEKSQGCIRMLNEDIEWLFDLIIPEKSKIAIKP